jgi:quinolinate synthase
VRDALRTLHPRITVPEDVGKQARCAIDRMLAL